MGYTVRTPLLCSLRTRATAPAARSSTLPLDQGYDWLLIDTQHGPMDREHMGVMISAVHAGGAKAFVRVGIGDRDGIQCVKATRAMATTLPPRGRTPVGLTHGLA